jgi:hypothetical protein
LPNKPLDVKTSRFRYLWWAEFQKRGALHYHMVLIDPPFEYERDARHWFDAHWSSSSGDKLADIQTWVEWRSGAWFRSRAGNYILKDVRKVGGKHYEQDYTRMPRGWRTFRSHQLTRTAAEHQEHETKALTVCTARPDAPWHERQRDVWIERIDHHVPASCGCKMFSRKSKWTRSSKNSGQFERNNLVSKRGTIPLNPGQFEGRPRPGQVLHTRATTGFTGADKAPGRLRGTVVPPSLNPSRTESQLRSGLLPGEDRDMAQTSGSN